jgi:hypothetical protein
MPMRTPLPFVLSLVVPSLVLVAAPLAAQDETALRQYFEGRQVTVKLDMPGSDDGVDILPGTTQPLDFQRYAGRLRQLGTALRSGQSVMVTKVKVKSNLIEFQLGGGGFGTSGDDDGTSVAVVTAAKTTRERNLERDVKAEQDPRRKRAMQEELDDLRRAREREDARNRAAMAGAQEQKLANVRQRRLEGGSRFNLRFRDRVPAEALTPQGVKAALAAYVDFPASSFSGAVNVSGGVSNLPGGALGGSAAGTPDGPRDATLRKGLLFADVEAMMGPAMTMDERKEGRLTVSTRTYAGSQGRVTADFVEGVLIRYSISSE